MIVKETDCTTGSKGCSKGVKGQNESVGNGSAAVSENGAFINGSSGGSSPDGLRTYKRRKHTNTSSSQAKLVKNVNVFADKVRELPKQEIEVSMDTVVRSSLDAVSSGAVCSRLNNSRNIFLDQLYQSVRDTEGGLLGYDKDKTSIHGCRYTGKCLNGTNYNVNGPLGGVTCNVSSSKSTCTKTDLCRRVFGEIVMSEKFAQLSDLLLTNFHGAKVDSILDISIIDSKMKHGDYEKSPVLFHSDMLQLWAHLQKVGAEIDALSKSLMDKLSASYSKQFSDMESDLRAKPEETETYFAPKVCTCRRCGEKAEGRDCLVCDSCEEMYHVSCIEPAVEEIPTKSWYCINCVVNGIESPHDHCVVCEKLNSILPPNKGVDDEELSVEFENESNGLAKHEIELRKGGHICNICKIEVHISKKYKVCGHSLCPHRYYHMKCLTNKQLNTYGPCWYCPSCLCRACLTDQDDQEIVLCDGCDSAYHTYCMQPPQTMIPQGKWFCVKCDVGIQRIAEAKKAYERIQSELEKRGKICKRKRDETRSKLKNRGKHDKRIADEEAVDKSEGVDMLLTAAQTLKYEENMAAVEK